MAYGPSIPRNQDTTNANGGTKVGEVSIPIPPENPIQENLFTDGSEYALENGTPYTGSYHIHPDKGPMVGAIHITQEHAYLYPLTTYSNNESPSPIGDIIFNKKIYSRGGVIDKLESGFSELSLQKVSVDIEKFFDDYNDVFFEIPKTGENSHSTLVQKSKNFINNFVDPKDAVIDNLNTQIQELELQLAEAFDKEHPVFTNGSLIELAEPHQYYFMDRGFRRYVNWNDTMMDIIKMKAYGNTDNANVPVLTPAMMNSIPQGYPNLSEDNFGEIYDPTLNESAAAISFILFQYDQNGDPDVDPNNYDDKTLYFEALEADITQKRKVINKLNAEISKLTQQINPLKLLDEQYFIATYGTLTGTGSTSGNGGSTPAGGRSNGGNSRNSY